MATDSVYSDRAATVLTGIRLDSGVAVLPGLSNSFEIRRRMSVWARYRPELIFCGLVLAYGAYLASPLLFGDGDDSQYDSLQLAMFNFGDVVALQKKKPGALEIEVDEVFGNEFVKEKDKVYDVDGEDPRISGAVNPYQMGNVTMPVDLNPEIVPEYPTEVRMKGIEGKVMLEMVVGDDGRVLRVRVAKGLDPLLDAAARKAFQQKKYEPARGPDGKGVTVKYYQPVQFRLN